MVMNIKPLLDLGQLFLLISIQFLGFQCHKMREPLIFSLVFLIKDLYNPNLIFYGFQEIFEFFANFKL